MGVEPEMLCFLWHDCDAILTLRKYRMQNMSKQPRIQVLVKAEVTEKSLSPESVLLSVSTLPEIPIMQSTHQG